MMFQGWRLKLREAEEAAAQGRLHEAERLLREERLVEYLPGRRLADRVALRLAEHARKLLVQGDTAVAWRDFEAARRLGGNTDAMLAVWREMTELVLLDVETRLRAGDVGGAQAILDRVERQLAQADAVRKLREVARRLEVSQQQAVAGKFSEAVETLGTLVAQHGDWSLLLERRQEYEEKAAEARELSAKMHRALAAENWNEALQNCDRLLALAPQCALARDVRKRAWARVGARFSEHRRLAETHVWPSAAERPAPGTPGAQDTPGAKDAARPVSDTRFVLWIDGVGGFLVCTKAEIVLGQAAPGNDVDVAIQGDVSRRHAVLRREGDSYILEPLADVRVAGRVVTAPTLLADDDEIELGPVVRLRFRQPHALSASARLDFLSRHKPQPSADAVLLMAESCVLGPRKSNHVLCRDWSSDVILFRRDDKLYCRALETLEIDGRVCEGRGEVTRQSHVVGSDFSLSLEPA